MPGPVSIVTYSVPVPAEEDLVEVKLQEALHAARSEAVAGLPVDPLVTPTFVASASGSCLHTGSSGMAQIGICEAYSAQSALAHVEQDTTQSSNAVVGEGVLQVPCVATAPGTAVLGAVLRQVDSAAPYMREDVASYVEGSLSFPPPTEGELTAAVGASMPGWSAGEDGVGEVAALILPWEVHRTGEGGGEHMCTLPVHLPEEGAYALRLVVAPADFVRSAADASSPGAKAPCAVTVSSA